MDISVIKAEKQLQRTVSCMVKIKHQKNDRIYQSSLSILPSMVQ